MNGVYCLVCEKPMGNSLNKDSDGEPVHKHCMHTLESEDDVSLGDKE